MAATSPVRWLREEVAQRTGGSENRWLREQVAQRTGGSEKRCTSVAGLG